MFAISRNVAARLRRFNGIEASRSTTRRRWPSAIAAAPSGDYLLMPSRLNGPKRQDLVVEALARTRQPVRVVFIGAADDPAWARP